MRGDLQKMERVLKALANRRRLAILTYLKKNKEANVGSISEEIKLSFKATSKHLGVLFAADIVEREQSRLNMNYRIGEQLDLAAKVILNLL